MKKYLFATVLSCLVLTVLWQYKTPEKELSPQSNSAVKTKASARTGAQASVVCGSYSYPSDYVCLSCGGRTMGAKRGSICCGDYIYPPGHVCVRGLIYQLALNPESQI